MPGLDFVKSNFYDFYDNLDYGAYLKSVLPNPSLPTSRTRLPICCACVTSPIVRSRRT